MSFSLETAIQLLEMWVWRGNMDLDSDSNSARFPWYSRNILTWKCGILGIKVNLLCLDPNENAFWEWKYLVTSSNKLCLSLTQMFVRIIHSWCWMPFGLRYEPMHLFVLIHECIKHKDVIATPCSLAHLEQNMMIVIYHADDNFGKLIPTMAPSN